jgi:predicted permease
LSARCAQPAGGTATSAWHSDCTDLCYCKPGFTAAAVLTPAAKKLNWEGSARWLVKRYKDLFISIMNDLRYSARSLLREPGFTAVAVLMVAIGIGANTAIFSIVNGVLLQPLPYRNPGRLVTLREVMPAFAKMYPTLPVSAWHFTQWRQRVKSLERLAAVQTNSLTLTGSAEPAQIDCMRVSASLLDVLGVHPALGRGFLPGEDQEGKEHVVILSDSLWRRRFNADPAILGRAIQLDSQAFTVVGILPGWFRFPNLSMLELGKVKAGTPQIFVPLAFNKEEMAVLMGRFNYEVVARLESGVGLERATAELNMIAQQLVKESGEKVELRASVAPLLDSMVGASRRGLLVLLSAVGAVLLIVCVNLANLMLARAERRGRNRLYGPRWELTAASCCGRHWHRRC